MAHSSSGRIPRSRRLTLREKSERASLARVLNIPRGSSWEDIFLNEQAQEIEASNKELADLFYDLGMDEVEYDPDEWMYAGGYETPEDWMM